MLKFKKPIAVAMSFILTAAMIISAGTKAAFAAEPENELHIINIDSPDYTRLSLSNDYYSSENFTKSDDGSILMFSSYGYDDNTGYEKLDLNFTRDGVNFTTKNLDSLIKSLYSLGSDTYTIISNIDYAKDRFFISGYYYNDTLDSIFPILLSTVDGQNITKVSIPNDSFRLAALTVVYLNNMYILIPLSNAFLGSVEEPVLNESYSYYSTPDLTNWFKHAGPEHPVENNENPLNINLMQFDFATNEGLHFTNYSLSLSESNLEIDDTTFYYITDLTNYTKITTSQFGNYNINYHNPDADIFTRVSFKFDSLFRNVRGIVISTAGTPVGTYEKIYEYDGELEYIALSADRSPMFLFIDKIASEKAVYVRISDTGKVTEYKSPIKAGDLWHYATGDADDIYIMYQDNYLLYGTGETDRFFKFGLPAKTETYNYDGIVEFKGKLLLIGTNGSFSINKDDIIASIDPSKVLYDGGTNISVKPASGTFDDGTALQVSSITSGTLYTSVSSKLKDNINLFDISLTKSGNTLSPSRAVLASFAIPEGTLAIDCAVYQVSETGELTKVTTTASSGRIVFNSDSLGKYVFNYKPYISGDVNGDKEVDIVDMMAVRNVIMHTVSDPSTVARADANFDTETDITDMLAVRNIIIEK